MVEMGLGSPEVYISLVPFSLEQKHQRFQLGISRTAPEKWFL